MIRGSIRTKLEKHRVWWLYRFSSQLILISCTHSPVPYPIAMRVIITESSYFTFRGTCSLKVKSIIGLLRWKWNPEYPLKSREDVGTVRCKTENVHDNTFSPYQQEIALEPLPTFLQIVHFLNAATVKFTLNLNSVNQLIFVMVKCGVVFEVRTEFLNNI
jgi:hypothetical protein